MKKLVHSATSKTPNNLMNAIGKQFFLGYADYNKQHKCMSRRNEKQVILHNVQFKEDEIATCSEICLELYCNKDTAPTFDVGQNRDAD